MYGHKFLMYRGILNSFQFVQQLTIFPMVYYFLKVAKSRFILKTIMNNAFPERIITFLNRISLELYLAHIAMQRIFEQLGIWFPLNVAVFVGASFCSASLFHYGAGFLAKGLERGRVGIFNFLGHVQLKPSTEK